MTTDPGVHDASAASASLLDATAAHERLAGRARWARPLYLFMAAGSSTVLITAGFAGVATILVVTGLFAVVTVLLAVKTARQGVVPRRFTRLHVTTMIAWGVAYVVALQVVANLFRGVAGYWVPVTAVVTVPFLVAAVLAGRSGRTTDPR